MPSYITELYLLTWKTLYSEKKEITYKEIPGMFFHFVFNFMNSKFTSMYGNGTSQTEETKPMVEHPITHLEQMGITGSFYLQDILLIRIDRTETPLAWEEQREHVFKCTGVLYSCKGITTFILQNFSNMKEFQ